MINKTHQIMVGIILTINVAVAAFAAFLVWFISVWMLDDHLAFTLSTWGWLWIALQRLGVGIVTALLVGAVLFGINSLLIRLLRGSYRRLPRYLAVGATTITTLAAIAGSIQFAITKPFV